LRLSRYVAADAYFAREPFVDTLLGEGVQLITRLRKDARLRYLYNGPRLKRRRGRPKTYDGRINPYALREEHFTPCAQAEEGLWAAYQSTVNVQSWKRNAKVVVVHHLDDQGQVKSASASGL
jgi:hypothetical protein